MRILVCVKQVPDAGEAQISMDAASHTLQRERMQMVLNPVDGCSFEMALRLKEQYGGSVSLISMGPPKAGELLRSLSAVGGDQFYLISDPAYAGADTYATAHTLHRAVRYLGGVDLILCGERTTDGETGQVGPSLAAMLGWEFAGCVTGIHIQKESRENTETDAEERGREGKTVVCEMPDGTHEYSLPLVVTVRRNCVLRYPGLLGLRRSAKTQIQTLDTAALGEAAASPTQVIRVERKEIGRRQAVWYPSGETGIRQLLADTGIGTLYSAGQGSLHGQNENESEAEHDG